jgi:hypothetical protein
MYEFSTIEKASACWRGKNSIQQFLSSKALELPLFSAAVTSKNGATNHYRRNDAHKIREQTSRNGVACLYAPSVTSFQRFCQPLMATARKTRASQM